MQNKKRKIFINRVFCEVKRILPTYAYFPLLTILVFNFVTYYGTRLFTNSMVHHYMGSKIDDFIPFWPVFICFYLLAYLQWIIGYIVIARESKEEVNRILFAEFIAKFFCLICFLVIPTTMVRPEVVGNNLVMSVVSFIYRIDQPVNLFPSIHCLESWMCFRGSMKLQKVSRKYKWFMFFSSCLVCFSTVLVKQHVFFDVIAGILVVEIGLFLSNRWKKWNLFSYLNLDK